MIDLLELMKANPIGCWGRADWSQHKNYRSQSQIDLCDMYIYIHIIIYIYIYIYCDLSSSQTLCTIGVVSLSCPHA